MSGIGAWRDLFNNVLRSPEQVETALGVDCVALVPFVASHVRAVPKKPPLEKVLWSRAQGGASDPRTPPACEACRRDCRRRAVLARKPRTVRAIKLAIDQHTDNEPGGGIIGVTSSTCR